MTDAESKRLRSLLNGRPLPREWAPNLSRYDQVMQRGFADLLVKLLTMIFGKVSTEIAGELHEMEPMALHILFGACETYQSLDLLMEDARLLDRAIAPVKRKRFPMNFPVLATGLIPDVVAEG
jgi:hypothetical protein